MGTKEWVMTIATLAALIVLGSCKNKSDDPTASNNTNGGNNSGGNNTGNKVLITGTSPEYTWWGDELTIIGTGFSAVKAENKIRFVHHGPGEGAQGNFEHLNLTSDGGDIEITSASETELKIRIPYEVKNNDFGGHQYLGLDGTYVEVTVNAGIDTSDVVKFLGLPTIRDFEYHYGWHEELHGVTRIGDSVLIRGGFSGMLWGNYLYPTAAGYYDKLRLRINGAAVPSKYRVVSGHQGIACYLPTSTYGDVKCNQSTDGWNDRPMTFELYVEGTDKKDQQDLLVQYLPQPYIKDVEGSTVFSKSAGGTPEWHVTGKDMFYTIARFTPTLVCDGAVVVEEAVQNPNVFSDELVVGIPLSLLAKCNYTVVLYDPCGVGKTLASVGIGN